ncbi:hypothetical protein [Bradyrhizobium diazoefficiens]
MDQNLSGNDDIGRQDYVFKLTGERYREILCERPMGATAALDGGSQPVPDPRNARAEGAPRQAKETKAGALVMLTPTGRAYTKRYFNEHWREDCDKVDAINAETAANGKNAPNTSKRRTLISTRTAARPRRCSPKPAPEIAEALCWSVDKAQKVIDLYLARGGVLAANAIRKLEDYRDRTTPS